MEDLYAKEQVNQMKEITGQLKLINEKPEGLENLS